MKKLMFIFLAMFFVFGISVSQVMAASYTYGEGIPESSVYFTEPNTTKWITGIEVAPGEEFTFDVWISDVPTGHNGLKTWFLKVWVGDKLESGDLAEYVTFEPLDGFDAMHMEPGIAGYYGPGWTGIPKSFPGPEGNVPLLRLTYKSRGSGTTTISPASYYEGLYADFQMCDGSDLLNIGYQGMNLVVGEGPPSNQPPVAKDQSVQTYKNESVDITLVATDADNDPLTYSITSLPSHASLKEGGTEITTVPYSLSGDTVTYTPDTDYTGSDSFTFKANDGKEDSNVATVSITVKEEGDFQSITPEPISINARPGDEFTFSVMYDASDSALTGIVFYVHYNSSYLDFVEASNVFEKGFMGLIGPEDDIDDKDNNPLTDKRFLIAWADLTPPPSWPGSKLPLSLMDITFYVKQWICPPVDTLINFTKKDTAQGCAFLSTPMELHIVSFHLDIDDNGRVEALTDGLLVIRYLFGFTGEDLIDGAIGADANRDDPDEIADWIETGISEEYLDIDDNGAVTPLTDGLLVIRYLFGFRGEDLVIGATDPDGGRTDPSEIVEYIEENLMPF